MPKTSDYRMFCPIARALDVLGDRWTMLVMRDLVNGDRRFTDLRSSLVGIPPNVLSQRLKALMDEGLVETKELPPPAARTVYTATEQGMATAPILRALVRFGVSRLGPADEGSGMPARSAVGTAVAAFYRADPTVPDERYELVVDGERFVVTSARGGMTGDDRPPSASITVPSWVLTNVRTGVTTWDGAVAAGQLVATGPKRAVSNFRRVFQLIDM